ncbi:TPA: terminase large subunit, partial [Yersinia enterocolitica]|nr:terminase large subunit [Yersinia enterocolitica]
KIKLEPWQQFIFAVGFGWLKKKNKLRRFTEIYVEVPRKNGKSLIAAGVGNYMFCADGEFGAEVYCGAVTEKQAWKVFQPALLMVQKLPAMRKKFSIKPWAKKMTRPDGSVFEPVIGDPGDGDSPSCAIIDEYHEHATDSLYTTMTTGMGSRSQPMTLIITTAGFDMQSPCYEKRTQIVEILEGIRKGGES